MRKTAIALAAALASLAAVAGPSHARDLHVPTQYATLAEGLASAEPGDRVLVAHGTYRESGLDLRGGISLIGDPDDPGRVVIDGGRQGRVLRAESLAHNVVVAGLTITGGLADGPTHYDRSGGGMFISDADVRLDHVAFVANEAASSGGGLRSRDSSPVLVHCVFRDNVAGEGGGGFDCSYGGQPSLIDCTFQGNSAAWGGGAAVRSGGRPDFLDCRFVSNTALVPPGLGGAVSCDLGAAPTLTGCVVRENHAKFGGGVFIGTEAAPRLSRGTLNANVAVMRGGGLYCNGASPSLEHTIVSFHVRDAILCKADARPTLTACDLFGNDGGDWAEPFADQLGRDGNISADPLFCSPVELTLHEDSPCAPQNSRVGLIGALDVACNGQTSATGFRVEPATAGLQLRWSTDRAGPDLRVEASVADGPTRELIVSELGGGEFAAMDPAPPAGRRVTYRLYGRIASDRWELLADISYEVPEASPATTPLQAHPNPFNPRTTATFSLDRTREARLAVYDLAGRCVRTLHQGTLAAGDHTIVWQGRDDAGRQLPSGTYLLVLASQDLHQSVKLLLVR